MAIVASNYRETEFCLRYFSTIIRFFALVKVAGDPTFDLCVEISAKVTGWYSRFAVSLVVIFFAWNTTFWLF